MDPVNTIGKIAGSLGDSDGLPLHKIRLSDFMRPVNPLDFRRWLGQLPTCSSRLQKRVPVMLSVTWASGPPIHMRVPVTVMLSGAKHLLFLCLHKQILRFLESDGLHRSPEIGLRRCAPQNDKAVSEFRRSGA